MTGQEGIEKIVVKLEENVRFLEEGSVMDAVIYPLHGSLPPELQVRVLSPPPVNCRRFIVATNIAETSLTVDGVVYVIDAGYVKERRYNPVTGMYSFDVSQINRVQANQRAGQAGITRAWKCYRLYTSEVYHEEFMEAAVPEIQRTSLAGSVLYLKSLNLPDIDILKFDFLDPPSFELLSDALRQLYLIDGIDENGGITRVGRVMAELPLEPSLSRTLMKANDNGSLAIEKLGTEVPILELANAICATQMGESYVMNSKDVIHSELMDLMNRGDEFELESWITVAEMFENAE